MLREQEFLHALVRPIHLQALFKKSKPEDSYGMAEGGSSIVSPQPHSPNERVKAGSCEGQLHNQGLSASHIRISPATHRTGKVTKHSVR